MGELPSRKQTHEAEFPDEPFVDHAFQFSDEELIPGKLGH